MNSKPFIVAELSANHNGSFDRALKIVAAAKTSGADAIKLQTFDPDKMSIPNYLIKKGAWNNRNLRDLYRQSRTPYEWHKELFDYAKDIEITAFSTPFSQYDVEFLEKLDCQIYKIASFEMIDLDLIATVANTGKPLIISTGAAQTHEIRAAVHTAKNNGCKDLTLLHCISAYPANYEQVNLETMKALSRFDCKIGISDHTLGHVVPVVATTFGATVIEKHLTLSREDGGLDARFSMEPEEFREMVDACEIAAKITGKITFGPKEGEETIFRRSLYYAQDLRAGTAIERHHLKTARPALGISPLEIDKVIGKTLERDVYEHDPVQY